MFLPGIRVLIVVLLGAVGFALGRSGNSRGDASAPEAGDSSRERVGVTVSALTRGVELPLGGTVFEIAMAIATEVEEGGTDRFPGIWSAVQSLAPGERERLEGMVIGWWAEDEPLAALEAVGQNYGLKEMVYQQWAERDPEAAWARTQEERYDSIREDFGEDIVVGLGRVDLEGAISLASREGIEFDWEFFNHWYQEAPGGVGEVAERMIELAETEVFSSGDFESLLSILDSDEDRMELFELVVSRSGEWRDAFMVEMVEEVMDIDAAGVFARAMEDPSWLGEHLTMEEMFEDWRHSEGNDAARELYESLAADDPLRVELAAEFLDAGMFQTPEQAEQVYALVPEESRASAVYDVAAYYLPDSMEPDSVPKRLAWVDQWRFELGPRAFERAIENHLDSFSSEEVDDLVELGDALAAADRFGGREDFLQRFAYITPELATPWLVDTLPPDERAQFMATAVENFLEDEPEDALEFFPTLSVESDIEALLEGIKGASVPQENREAAMAIYEELTR